MIAPAENMKPATTYLRCSTDSQDRSVADQRSEADQYARLNNYELVSEYPDEGISGTTAEERPAFMRMIADAQKPDCPFKYVLTYDVKRFSRGDVDEAGYYRHLLKQHGVEVVYISEVFAGNDTDDIVRSVKQFLARQESKDLSKVTLRGQVSSVRDGWWAGGTPPYGFDLQYFDRAGTSQFTVRFLESGEKQVFGNDGNLSRTIAKGERLPKADTDKAKLVLSSLERVALVKRVFDMYLRQGLGYKAIAEILNIEGILSPRNGTWSRNTGQGWSQATIRSIIMNPLYQGCMVWNRRASGRFHRLTGGRAEERKGVHTNALVWNDESDWEVIPKTHPPIIDSIMFEEARRLREARSVKRGGESYRSGRARHSPFLLSGLIVCGQCEHKFHGYTINSTKRKKNSEKIKTLYYACGGAVAKGKAHCERRLVRKDELESDILGRIKTRVDQFLNDGGYQILREFIAGGLKNSAEDPRQQRKEIKNQLGETDSTIDRLLNNLTEVNREFIDKKIVKLKRERNRLESELETLDRLPKNEVDADALAEEIIANMGGFEELFEEGTLEEQKQFIRQFVEKIELNAEERRARVHIRRFPAPESPATGNSSFQMVAGAHCKHQKKVFPPVDSVEIPLVCRGRGATLVPVGT